MKRLFALDLRSLALARVALFGTVLADLAVRAGDLPAHYSDAGVLPVRAYAPVAWDFLFSVHSLLGSSRFEAGLFALAAVFAVAGVLGYWTRLATLGTWAMLLSLHARNPLLRDGQDDLLRVVFFFAIFLPWGERWSLDAKRKVTPARSSGWAEALFTAQLGAVYLASAFAKLRSPWWRAGDGVRYSLSLLRYETHLGHSLLASPRWVLLLSNHAVIAVELLLPLLLILGGDWKRPARQLAFALAVLMHLGFGLGMKLGLFPWVSLAAWLAFLPGGDVPLTTKSQSTDAFAGACALVLIAAMNLRYLAPRLPLPTPLVRVGQALGLQQYWALFAPDHLSAEVMTDGYFLALGVGADAVDHDLWNAGAPPRMERPELVSATFKNRRWRHLFSNLTWDWPAGSEQQRTVGAARDAWAGWMCREWRASHPEPMRAVRLVYVYHRLGAPNGPWSYRTLVARACAQP